MNVRDLEALARDNIICRRCEAAPGEDCKTISGNRSSRLHSVRVDAIYQVWRSGYQQGGLDIARHYSNNAQSAVRHMGRMLARAER